MFCSSGVRQKSIFYFTVGKGGNKQKTFSRAIPELDTPKYFKDSPGNVPALFVATKTGVSPPPP